MKEFENTLALADAVLAGPDRDDGSILCRRCGGTALTPPDLEPTAFCNPCAQWAAEELAQHVIGLSRELAAVPAFAGTTVGWKPPGGLARPKRSFSRRRK